VTHRIKINMRISKWTVIVLTAAAVGVGVITTSKAAGAAKEDRPTRGRLLEAAKEKLGITDEQAAQIKSALKSEKENITPLIARLHDARAELRTAIRASDANESSVRAASAKVAAVEADIAVERLKLHSKIAPVLTDEQRAKLSQMGSKLDELIERAIDRAGKRLSE
jgi:Spy/CpxP family protein refolding chaperone